MKININNKEYETEQTNLLALLKDAGFEKLDGLALAINDEIIPRNSINQCELKDGDNVTIIHITCGG